MPGDRAGNADGRVFLSQADGQVDGGNKRVI
jgi:hypothetical protein